VIGSRNEASLTRIVFAGVAAAVVAAVGDAVVYALARAIKVTMVMPYQPGIQPAILPIGTVVSAAVVGAIAATVVFAVLSKVSPNGVRVFQIVGGLFLVLTFAAPLSVASTDTATRVTLLLMHIVAGSSIIASLTLLGRR